MTDLIRDSFGKAPWLTNQIETKITLSQAEKAIAFAAPFLGEALPQIEVLRAGENAMIQPFAKHLTRPGGAISGPVIMGLADLGAYLAVLSYMGLEPMAVTSGLQISFLSPAAPGDLRLVTRLIKPGKKLCVTESLFFMVEEPDRLVAQATATYSLPKEPSGLWWD